MKEYSIKRNGKNALTFVGERLVSLDDREWMGVTPNWWELALYRTSVGKYILESIFHINYPHRRILHGAISFSSANVVREYLTREWNGPSMIAEALLGRAARRDDAFLGTMARRAPQPAAFTLSGQLAPSATSAAGNA